VLVTSLIVSTVINASPTLATRQYGPIKCSGLFTRHQSSSIVLTVKYKKA